jgi:hypothetical protein
MSERMRETAPALVDAGAAEANERGRQAMKLPFNPDGFDVDELPAKLAEVSEERAIQALQVFDTRITAAGHYERRINELRGGAASKGRKAKGA